MINDWKEFLKVNDFEKFDRRDFLRRSMPISALIYETPLRVRRREVRINVAVEIHDPWLYDRTYHVPHLKGDVTPEGIYIHYDETPRWIHPEEKDFTFAVIEQCLIDWIGYWSDPHHLIQYFENPVDIVMTRRSDTGRLCEHISGIPVKKRGSPHENYLLSLLYYHIGDLKKALPAAERYLQFIRQTSAFVGEPERTKRQIEELSSKLK